MVSVGAIVTLEGSASDLDGDALTYGWVRSGGTGPAVTLSDGESPAPTFTASGTGVYRFTLTVTDARGGSASASTVVTVVDDHPDAAAETRDPQDTLSDSVPELTGVLGVGRDTDFFRLVLEPGVDYELSTVLEGLQDTVLTLFAADGRTRLALNDDFAGGRASRLEFQGPSTGVLFTSVGSFRAPAVGGYRIGLRRIVDDHPDTAGAVRDPQDRVSSSTPQLGGNLERPDDVDFFRLEGNGGETLVVETLLGSLTDTVLAVFDSDGGTLLGQNDDAPGTRASRVKFDLPSAGVATARVRGFRSRDPRGSELSYDWVLESVPAGSIVTQDSFFVDSTVAMPRVTVTANVSFARELINAGEYRVALIVTSEDGLTSTDRMTLIAADPNALVPSSDAGLNRAIEVTVVQTSPSTIAATVPDPTLQPPDDLRALVRLDGRQSADPNDPPQPLTYQWTVLETPPRAAPIMLGSSATPSFVPVVGGTYRFQLLTRNLRFQSNPSDVEIRVLVRDGDNSAPIAEAFVRDRDGTRRAGPLDAALLFQSGVGQVVLDASRSTDRENPEGLQYRWTQVAGVRVSLAPGDDGVIVSLVPPTPDLYGLPVTVSDPGGLTDATRALFALATLSGSTPPSLTVSASTAIAVGEPVPLDPAAAPPRSLRTTLGTTVVLRAVAEDPDVGTAPLNEGLLFDFRQVAGPPVLLTTRATGLPLEAEARFVPTTSRVHEFEVRVTELDSAAVPTGVERARRIRIIVDSGQNGVPVAQASIVALKDAISTCTILQLDGSQSGDVGPNPSSGLRYTWVQQEGPAVILSAPFSVQTTFVLPDLGDDVQRTYRFQLFVDDGEGRSEPAPVSFAASPSTSRGAEIPLLPGPNLVSFPVQPSGDSAPPASRLLALAGVRFGVLLPEPEDKDAARFRAFSEDFAGVERTAVKGNQGALIINPGPARSVPVPGVPWGSDRRSRLLRRGVNLVSYPRQTPPGETTETLRQRALADYVVGTVPGPSGRARFRVHLPGLTQPFPIREGCAYLLSSPASRVLTFPACGQ